MDVCLISNSRSHDYIRISSLLNVDISWASIVPGEDDLRTVLSAPSMEMTVALGEAAEDDIALL